MGVGVGQRSETVVVLLASRIPKRQLNVLSIHLDIGNVVLEDGGDVDLRVARLVFFFFLRHPEQQDFSGIIMCW